MNFFRFTSGHQAKQTLVAWISYAALTNETLQNMIWIPKNWAYVCMYSESWFFSFSPPKMVRIRCSQSNIPRQVRLNGVNIFEYCSASTSRPQAFRAHFSFLSRHWPNHGKSNGVYLHLMNEPIIKWIHIFFQPCSMFLLWLASNHIFI